GGNADDSADDDSGPGGAEDAEARGPAGGGTDEGGSGAEGDDAGAQCHTPDEVRHDSCEGPGCGSGEDTDHHGADGVEVERDGCVVADDLPDDDVQGDGDGDEREDAAWDEGQGAGGEQQAAEEVESMTHRVVWPRSTPRFIG